jgi:Flp pilus assembly protein TadD
MKANPARNGVSKARILRRTLFLLPALLLGTCSFGQTATQNGSSPRPSSDELLEQHLGKGYEALKQEKYGDAGEEFRAALGIDATLVMRARFPLAIALFEEHQTAEARRELETARKVVGDQPSVLYYLGRLDVDEHGYKKAITNHYLGLVYARDGNTQDAEKWLKGAVRLHPDDSRRATGEGLEELRPRST